MIDLLDLKRFLVTTLRADAVLKSTMGITTADPRVYAYYQPSATIDASHQGYLTYAMTANPERLTSVTQTVFTLAVWALHWEACHAIRNRCVALLDCSGDVERTMTTPAGIRIQPLLVHEHDSAQENTKFAGIQMTFKLGQSFS